MMSFQDIKQVYNPFRMIVLHYLKKQIKNAKKAKSQLKNKDMINADPIQTYKQLCFAYLVVKHVDVAENGEIARQNRISCTKEKMICEDAVSYDYRMMMRRN